MKLCLQKSDVLDQMADALIYSTNVLLNCSGGVGASLEHRYGNSVQLGLHALLSQRSVNYVTRGEVIELTTPALPYKQVYHTLPCDAFYETTEDIVADVMTRSLSGCAEHGGIRSVVMVALATGYGRLEYDDFFRIADGVIREGDFKLIEKVTICVADDYRFTLASKQIVEERLSIEVT